MRKRIPALTRGRLSWVEQNYFRPDTVTKANVRLVDAQREIPLVQSWGGGEVASADGMRFVVPVQTLNAGANSKYFNRGRGITYAAPFGAERPLGRARGLCPRTTLPTNLLAFTV